MEITQSELGQYTEARKAMLKKAGKGRMPLEYNRYSLESWIHSKLPYRKYIYIADFIDKGEYDEKILRAITNNKKATTECLR